MKLQIISDLHQEFGTMDLNFHQADVVIFAGDVDIGTRGVKWMLSEFSDKLIVYVLGNHEYYKGSYPRTLYKIQEIAQNTNVHVLENESVEIEGVTFHGMTLWTDFQLLGTPRPYGIICQEKMNDYKKIRRDPSYSKLRTIDTFNIHMNSIKWLENSLVNSKTDKNIVVSHHAPSIKSIPEGFKNDPVSSAYASNLDDVILKYQPEYWIHGHLHTPVKYKIGKTKVICNPHGYIDEEYNGFEKDLLVEV